MSLPEITPCFISVPNRGLIRVSGEDGFRFLQNLITNDLNQLAEGQLLHSCLLTAQGKYLHDFFISISRESYIIECEGGDRANDLGKLLNFYRLRAKVTIEITANLPVYVTFGDGLFKDPRHAALGSRIFKKPDKPEKQFSFWDDIRISAAVADGSRDSEIGKSTLSELNMEETSIDYNKGCYVGQELTARIHHRGLAKKHLFPVKFDGEMPAFGAPLFYNGKSIGEMRSSSGSIGLALLKDELLPPLRDGFYHPDPLGNKIYS
jgi:folate-binding protein YgfZ